MPIDLEIVIVLWWWWDFAAQTLDPSELAANGRKGIARSYDVEWLRVRVRPGKTTRELGHMQARDCYVGLTVIAL